VTRIEADAVLAAPPTVIWSFLLAYERWPEWCSAPDGGPAADGARLESVTLVAGPAERVGAERECTATVGPFPLLGQRTVRWTDILADVRADAPWHLEFDVVGARPPFARARFKVILVPGAPGESRLRLRLTYAPGPLYWPIDVLWLRRSVEHGLRRVVDGLSARWPLAAVADPSPAPAEAGKGRVRAAA
jgi:hypothetical protein